MNKYKKKGYIFTSIWDGFPRRPLVIGDRYSRWRKMAKAKGLSRKVAKWLDWIIYYYTTAGRNARLACRYFGLSPW